jgi:16S rRNA (cytidine1402-2'-O)-methyltransferase
MSPDSGAPGTLVLVPVPIDPEARMDSVLGADALARIRGLRHFIAENPRTARRFLAPVLATPIQEVSFAELSEHTPESALDALLAPLLAGNDCGLVSEAGCPAVADPGANLVARAHGRTIPVQPLPGPSAILLALMASGLEGQGFRFVGYLPRDPAGRSALLRALEADSARRRESVWFIETPYRNRALWKALLECLDPATRLSVSAGLGTAGGTSATTSVAQWQRGDPPDLERRPAVFGLQAPPLSASARPRPRRT